MNDQKTKRLVNDFPKVFRKIREIECGDGWEAIIREACEKIEPVLQDEVPDEENVYAVQIKEKFGALRFYRSHRLILDIHAPSRVGSYIDNNSSTAYSHESIDAIDAAIREAEKRSLTICEICGDPGRLRGGNWIRTLCDAHERDRLLAKNKIGS